MFQCILEYFSGACKRQFKFFKLLNNKELLIDWFFFFLSKHYTEFLNFRCAKEMFWVGLFQEICFVSEVADDYVVTIECHMCSCMRPSAFKFRFSFSVFSLRPVFSDTHPETLLRTCVFFCVRSWGKWTCNLLITWWLYGSKTSKATRIFIWSLGECCVDSTFYQHMWKHVMLCYPLMHKSQPETAGGE